MIGATRLYDARDQAADAIDAMAAKLRAAGGVFPANHPAYRLESSSSPANARSQTGAG
jgi:hypothetical protein